MAEPALFALKRILYGGVERTIVLQNENGPCPLLAVANALSLRGHLSHPAGAAYIRGDALCALVAGYVLDAAARRKADGALGDVDSAVDEAMEALPLLATRGLDLNPRFIDVDAFEFAANGLSVFDVLRIRLLHCWIVDPITEPDVAAALGRRTYNEAVEIAMTSRAREEAPPALPPAQTALANRVTVGSSAGAGIAAAVDNTGAALNLAEVAPLSEAPTLPSSPSAAAAPLAAPDDVSAAAASIGEGGGVPAIGTDESRHDADAARATIVRSWLEQTASQATVCGLAQVTSRIAAGLGAGGGEEVAALFRNNHVSTVVVHDGALYALMTDIGYERVGAVVWERLYDPRQPTAEAAAAIGVSTLCGHDFAGCAPQLQDDGGSSDGVVSAGAAGSGSAAQQQQEQSDFALALALQSAEGGVAGGVPPVAADAAVTAAMNDEDEQSLALALALSLEAAPSGDASLTAAPAVARPRAVAATATPSQVVGGGAASADQQQRPTPTIERRTGKPTAAPPVPPPARRPGSNNRYETAAQSLAQLAVEREARRGAPPRPPAATATDPPAARADATSKRDGCVIT